MRRYLYQLSETSNINFGELIHRTEKLSYPSRYVEADSVNNSYQLKSPLTETNGKVLYLPTKVARETEQNNPKTIHAKDSVYCDNFPTRKFSKTWQKSSENRTKMFWEWCEKMPFSKFENDSSFPRLLEQMWASLCPRPVRPIVVT